MATDERTRLFVADHARLGYGEGEREIVALDDLTVEVRRGEFLAIVGPSGCGKSTLLRIIAELEKTSAGTVDRPWRESGRLGLMFQSPVLMPWRNVIRNVMAAEELAGLRRRDRAAVQSRAAGILRMVGLDGFERRYPSELSGGMQQRVALARALTSNPALMLLDEPFGALDAMTRQSLNLELQRIWLQEDMTVVLVTHDVEEAVFLSDRVVVMTPRPGRVAAEIAVRLGRPRTLETKYDPTFIATRREIEQHLQISNSATVQAAAEGNPP